MTVTIGSDPEVMIQDVTSGRIISAAGLIGGTKGKATPMEGLPEGFGYQEDNVMVEYNVPATSDIRAFTRNIACGLDYIARMIERINVNYTIDREPCRVLMADQLTHPGAQTFGCSPDFNGHMSGDANPNISKDGLVTPEGEWRFNGGHVHIGYDAQVPKHIAAQFADVFIGLKSIGKDVQKKRRELYGTAGRYRPTPYGIEYRTLSNYWIFNSSTTKRVAQNAHHLGTYLEQSDVETIKSHYSSIPWIDVERAINTEDRNMAQELLAYVEQQGVEL